MEDWETQCVGTECEEQNLEKHDGLVVIHIGKDRKESVVHKILKYRPSTCHDNRIWILNSSLLTKEKMNFESMKYEWGEITSNGQEIPIDQWTIRDMAEKYNFKSGLWYFFSNTDDEADDAWDQICSGITGMELGAVSMAACIEINDITSGKSEKYSISVHNQDYTDEGQVYGIEKFLRKAGITNMLMYKMDIYTQLVIHKTNYHKMRPSLYRSMPNEIGPRNFLDYIRNHSKPQIIEYNMGACNNYLSLEQWRKQNSPSQYSRNPVICRIRVKSYDEMFIYKDLSSVLKSVRKHLSSQLPFTYRNIEKWAIKNKLTGGRWYFYVDSGYKVDIFWKFVVNGFINGKLDNVAISAEVMPSYSDLHVIKVYNRDYTNIEEVYQLEKLLREIGVKCTMMYEAIIYSNLGIYSKNFEEHGLDSAMYTSYYDALNHESTIDVLYANEFEQ